MRTSDIRALYYITHIDNLPSILERGILSHEQISAARISCTRLYDPLIVERRKSIFTSARKSLWHYANLFFQPRNPMLYRVIDEIGIQNLAVLRVSNTVLQEQGIFIADGIAANNSTHIYPRSEGLEILQTQQETIQSTAWVSWMNDGELRRKLMAECLVPDQVKPEYIQRFIVVNHVVAASLQARLSSSDIRKLAVADDEGSNIFTPSFTEV